LTRSPATLQVLPAHRVAGDVGRQRDRAQHLELLGADLGGVEARRLLHGHHGEQLHEVVLHHVAGGAGGVVERPPAADADVLGHGDLHRVDVPAVPDRLEHRVGEAQRQDVLHGLLAEVVIDAEHVLRGEHVVDQVVELLGRLHVLAERLLHDHPAPAAGLVVGRHARAAHLLEHRGERRRGENAALPWMPWLSRIAFRHVESRSKAASSSKEPGTNWMLPDRRAHTSSRQGVRACCWAASLASASKSPCDQSRRAKPTTTKLGGRRPRLARS
jgi:hypothetical protein